MANFLSRRKFKTKKPQIKVESGLPVGKHRFQVTAIYADGHTSPPVEVVVSIIRKPTRPTRIREPVGTIESRNVVPEPRSTKRPTISKKTKVKPAKRKKKS